MMTKQALLMIFVILPLLVNPLVGKTTKALGSSSLPQPDSGDPLIANFTYSPTDVVVTQPVSFSDQSTGAIVYWEWNFGDGAMANATTPQDASKMHSYDSVGEMAVSLIVVDNLNNTDSVSKTINVRKISTFLSLSNTTSTTEGSGVALTATLTDEYGNHVSGMDVSFYLVDNQGSQLIDSATTDPIGRATVYYQPTSSGAFQVNAVFNGTDIFAMSTSQTQTFGAGFNALPYAVIGSVAIIAMSIALTYLRWKSRKALTEEEPATSEEEQEK